MSIWQVPKWDRKVVYSSNILLLLLFEYWYPASFICVQEWDVSCWCMVCRTLYTTNVWVECTVYTGNLPADSARPPPAGDPGGLHGNYFKRHGDAALARVREIVAPPRRSLKCLLFTTPALTKAVVFSRGSVTLRDVWICTSCLTFWIGYVLVAPWSERVRNLNVLPGRVSCHNFWVIIVEL